MAGIDSGGEARPEGDLTLQRMPTAELATRIAAAVPQMRFVRAWLEAKQRVDGTVVTKIYGLAEYGQGDELRTCTVSYEVETDSAIEAAFGVVLAQELPEVARRAVQDAAISFVASMKGGD